MNKTRSYALRRAFVLGCAASSTLLAVAPAFAQDAAEGEEEVLETVVVTGSRIARPNLPPPTVPVTSVTADDIFSTGDLAVGDLLNDLPALRSTFAQSNSQRFLGTTGLNLLDLRGLGTQRTLVLVNGRRHVGADILSNAVSPDTNTFPSDLIERVDVVTGGSSAVYGSDAIAGVVNFVLKRDFEGVQFRGQGGESKYGDATNYFGSVVADLLRRGPRQRRAELRVLEAGCVLRLRPPEPAQEHQLRRGRHRPVRQRRRARPPALQRHPLGDRRQRRPAAVRARRHARALRP